MDFKGTLSKQEKSAAQQDVRAMRAQQALHTCLPRDTHNLAVGEQHVGHADLKVLRHGRNAAADAHRLGQVI